MNERPVCRRCGGEGDVEVDYVPDDDLGGYTSTFVVCPVCHGSGER